MKRHLKAIGTAAAIAALAISALGAVSAPADAVSATPKIIGGQKANNPWAFQLFSIVDRSTGSAQGCTSEALNDSWVLTAKHCVLKDPEDTSSVVPASDAFVIRSNNTADLSDKTKRFFADQIEVWDGGDLALLHFPSSNGLSSYPAIASAYTPSSADSGVAQGYGWRNECKQERPDWLYKAQVSVTGTSTDAYGGEAIHLKGIDGITNHGDSGGPFTLKSAPNAIVGVASTIDRSNCPANDIHETTNYTNVTLSAPREWIQSISGS